jgi:pyridoxine 4-dehydrogenase
MIEARDEGLIDGIGLSSITPAHLSRALEQTDIACVQNPLSLADRASMPILEECTRRGIAFVPFFPLGSAFIKPNPVLGNKHVISTAERLGVTAPQVALAWLLGVAPNVLLIPGTTSLQHLEENLAVADITLDAATQQELTESAG